MEVSSRTKKESIEVEMEKKHILLLAATNAPDAEREAQFADWNANTHVPQMCALPGVIKATRYIAMKQQKGQPRYMTIYELDGVEAWQSVMTSPRLKGIMEDVRKRWGDALQVSWSYLFEPAP